MPAEETQQQTETWRPRLDCFHVNSSYRMCAQVHTPCQNGHHQGQQGLENKAILSSAPQVNTSDLEVMELETGLWAWDSGLRKGSRSRAGRGSLLLGEALDFLSDPAHGRATLFLLGQHGHHGLCKQVRVFPMAYHLLENSRETEFRSQLQCR